MNRILERSGILQKIEEICIQYKIANYKIDKIESNPKGEGFLSEILFVTVLDNDNSNKKLHLVVKFGFTDEKIRHMAPIKSSFENEIYFYSTILPEFQKFTKSKEVNCLNMVPKCYGWSSDTEILVMQNLKIDRFVTYEKNKSLDDTHIKLIFKTYGIFHGVSMAFKDQCKIINDNFLKHINNVWEELTMKKVFILDMINILKLVDTYFIPGVDDKVKAAYEKYTKNAADLFKASIISDCESTIILHGDCWTNNMMFKYQNEEDRTPIDIRLIDFQLLKSGSPVCDLSYFFYNGSSKKYLDKLDYYLEIYHKSLLDTGKKLGSDIETLYPITRLKEEWKEFSKFGMMMSIYLFKLKAAKEGNVKEFADEEDTDERELDMNFDEELFKSKSLDLIHHMYEYRSL